MSNGDSGLHKRLLQAFNMEAEERLHALGTQLIALEEKVREGGPHIEDPVSARLVEDIHRELHSLKGASRAVGFEDIEQVCQEAESVLSAVKRRDIELTASSFDVLHAVVGLVEHLVRTVGGGRDDDAAGRLQELLTVLKAMERGEAVALQQHKPAKASADRPEAQDDAATAYDPGTPEPAAQQTPKEDATQPLQEPERRAGEWQGLPGAIRMPTEDMSAMRAMAEDIQGTQISLSRRLRSLRETADNMQRLDGLWTEALYEMGSNISGSQRPMDSGLASVSVQGEAMANFLDACRSDFSKISGTLSLLWHDLDKDRRQLEKNVGELSEAMKKALLMPMEALLTHFPRMVRELARQQGKEAVCEIEGADISMDRRILEILNDPFMHALRNAVDHGIETPEERTAAGKTEHGVVRIRIMGQGSGLVRIEIRDDGRGIDLDALRSKAVESGILDAQRAEALTREEAFGLVFLSDLSTAQQVSTLSGRGLGMAIVRGKVEQAGGNVAISSDKGRGTVLTIVVPVTLTSFNGVVFSAAGRRFVAPMDNMAKLILADRSRITETGGRKLLADNGEALPMASLAEVLSLPGGERDDAEAYNVLVARAGDDVAAIIVDEVLEEQEVVLKDLGPQLNRVRHIAGVTMLGSGELAPVLQLGDVVSTIVRPGAPRVRPSAPAPEKKKTQRVLVVEDSITSRMLIKNVLEAAGYEVLTAVDGMEGYAIMGSTPLDLVVSDVEMPRLDGFGLTEKIRADPRLADMPVVLVTSLDSREHRERGLNVGANAYIVKSKFDQSNLLEVIHSLL